MRVLLVFMDTEGTVTQTITNGYGMPIGYVVDIDGDDTDVFRADEVEFLDPDQ